MSEIFACHLEEDDSSCDIGCLHFDLDELAVVIALMMLSTRKTALQMPAAPAGDRGLNVFQMPLQGPLALGAAPAAVVLAGREHPTKAQLAQGFAAHGQRSAGLGRGHPDPVSSRWGWHRLDFHQPSPRTISTTAGFQKI